MTVAADEISAAQRTTASDGAGILGWRLFDTDVPLGVVGGKLDNSQREHVLAWLVRPEIPAGI